MSTIGLSKEAIELLQAVFFNANLNLPVTVSKQIVEVQEWITKQVEPKVK